MPLFNKQASYVSEVTRFITELKQTNPTLEAEQLAGRARLWDKQKIDLDDMRRQQQSRVKQKAYVYLSE
ncbi:MAG: DUF3460 family protein [Burkholderiaceae bacterium]|jgi:hypothetical protein